MENNLIRGHTFITLAHKGTQSALNYGFHKEKENIEKKKPAKTKRSQKDEMFSFIWPKNLNFQNKIKTSFMPQSKRASIRNLVFETDQQFVQ